MRKSLPLTLSGVVVASVLALAACSSGGSGDGSTSKPKAESASCQKTPSGHDSDSIKVSGEFSKTPTVTVPAPLKAKKTERTIVIEGKGKEVKPESTIDIALVAYNGTTGKQISSNGFDGQASVPVTVDDKRFIPGLVRGIECVPVGSRVVTTANVKDAFGGADPSKLGLKPTDSVVFIADVLDIMPTHATGKPQPAPAGFPKVKLAKDGQPSVTIPKSDPPTKTKVGVLKSGDGATVADGDTVTVQYQGTIWRTGKVFDQSWGSAPATFQTTGVVPGFSKGLVGQKVGSQVIVVIPPADGYGKGGNKKAGIKGTDTLVFVIDILKTSK